MTRPAITNRAGAMVLALLYTTLTFGAALSPSPAAAAVQSGPYYVAELAAPATETRAVAAGVAWSCDGTTCVANKGPSRPARICRGLVREFGAVTSFTVEGEALSEDKLATCNK